MAIRAELSSAIANLAALSVQQYNGKVDDPVYAGASWRHTSNLPQGRCLWIRGECSTKSLDLAVSVDSDTWFESQDLYLALAMFPASDPTIAMGIAPVVQGNGFMNLRVPIDGPPYPTHASVRELRCARIDELRSLLEREKPVLAGGFGLVVLNLNWWRANLPKPEPILQGIDTGEDIELCRQVTARGGKIIPLRVSTDHAAFQMP